MERSTGLIDINFVEGFAMLFDETVPLKVSYVKIGRHGNFVLGSTRSATLFLRFADLSPRLQVPMEVSTLIEADNGGMLDIISVSESTGGISESYLVMLTNSTAASVSYFRPVTQADFDESSVSRAQSDILEICMSSTKELISWCLGAAKNMRITTTSPESGQSEGSILILCDSSPADDSIMQGVACNPSTGDSWNFYVEKESETTFDDWVFCAECGKGQFFFLGHNSTSFSVFSIHSSLLHVDGAKVSSQSGLSNGRLNLFTASLPEQIPRSISVIPNPRAGDSALVCISFASDATGKTEIWVLQMTFLEETGLDQDDDDSSSTWLSIFVVGTLLALGIGFPIYVNRNPVLKTKLIALFTGKPEGSVLLQPYEVSMELSPIGKENTETPSPLSYDAPAPGRQSSKTKSLEVVIE